MVFLDRLAALCAQFPELRAQPGLLVSLAQSAGSDQQIRDVASFAQATSWRRVLESVPAEHAQAMWDQLPPTDRQRVLGSGYSPVIERNEGRGFWANNAPQQPTPEGVGPPPMPPPEPVQPVEQVPDAEGDGDGAV